jgi:hypothetical protein
MNDTSIFSGLVTGALGRWRRHRMHSRTRLSPSSLPPHLRKDIGWIDPVPERARRVPPGTGF